MKPNSRAASFLTTHGRILDRRRFELVSGNTSAETRAAVLAALDGYRNPDGGYGWGLEPDLRAHGSQPASAQHALAAITDAAPATSPHTVALLDWLQSVTLPDGGLPFALPLGDSSGCAPFWAQADPHASSLQITAAVATQAHRAARSDKNVKNHPWFTTATRYCLQAIRDIKEAPFAYVLLFALQFLDVASDSYSEARTLLDRLARFVPPNGALPVVGGAEGETLHLLDFAPEPGRPVRSLVDDRAVADDLDRLESGQQRDGGWAVNFNTYSPAAALEWRGYITVGAVDVLRMNGR